MGSSVNFYGQFNISHKEIVNFFKNKVDVPAHRYDYVILGKTGKERVSVISRLVEKIQKKHQQKYPCTQVEVSQIIGINVSVLNRLQEHPHNDKRSTSIQIMENLRFCILTNFVTTQKDLEEWSELFPPETFSDMFSCCKKEENKQAPILNKNSVQNSSPVNVEEINQLMKDIAYIDKQIEAINANDKKRNTEGPTTKDSVPLPPKKRRIDFPTNPVLPNPVLLKEMNINFPTNPVLPNPAPPKKMQINFLINPNSTNN
jgi:hypothetical protein